MNESFTLAALTLESDACPFEDWFRSLRDRQMRVRIAARLARVRAGNFGDHRSVGGGVSELRLDIGPGYRLYYALQEATIVALIIGGDKSSQDRDIEEAKRLWKEYHEQAERFHHYTG